MKHKQGRGKRKPKTSPALLAAAKEVVQNPNIVNFYNRGDSDLDTFGCADFNSRREGETQHNDHDESGGLANFGRAVLVSPRIEDNMSSFAGVDVSGSANLSKKSRSIGIKSPKGIASSSVRPCADADQALRGRTLQKQSTISHLGPGYKEQELIAALEVIRKIMEMDAAEPFNVPVDPNEVPDYYDIIHTPMDFGTIYGNLENGVKYKSSKDVFRDIQYVWDNCSKYNKKDSHIMELMKRVKKMFLKLWVEVGLDREQRQDTNGCPHLSPMKPGASCNTCEDRMPVESLVGIPRHLHHNQMEPSQLQLHQPSVSCSQSVQPQRSSCQCHQSFYQQQMSQPQADTHVGTVGHLRKPPVVRRNSHGHNCSVGPAADCSTCSQENQIRRQSQLHCHLPSSSCNAPCQPHQGCCVSHPCTGQPHPSLLHAGSDIANGESMKRCNQHGPQCQLGQMTDCISQHQFGHKAIHQKQSHQNSSSCVQQHQPLQGICQSHLSLSQPQPAQSQAVMSIGRNEGDSTLPPPIESMKRAGKRKPRQPAGPIMDGNNQQEDQRQPFQPHAGLDIYRNCDSASSPPMASTTRSTRCGLRYPADPVSNNTNSGLQDHTAQSQMQSHQHPANYSQPHQDTCQGQLNFSLPQPSNPSAVPSGCAAETCPVSTNSSNKKKRGRGPTRCLNLWNSKDKISVAINELGQPIGDEAPKLINFLGTIARNGHIAPLNYVDWRALPDENKEKMWQQVQAKFDVDPESKDWVWKSLGKKWKDWKAQLKSHHYSIHDNDEDRLADCDERVLPDQWRILVSFWNSNEAKERSVTNKANRSHQKINHTTGTKSFARIREEQRAKMLDGKEPSRAELFILTRTRKDGHPVNEASSKLISQLREQAAQQQETAENGAIGDDIFFQVMGHDRHGRVRTYGLGPSPSDIGSTKGSNVEAMKMVSEANKEVHEMKEKMVAMELTCAQMAAQMATMMSMMSAMHKKFPDGSDAASLPSEPARAGSVGVVPSNSDRSTPQEEDQLSSQARPSHQRITRKRGKVQSASINKASRRKR